MSRLRPRRTGRKPAPRFFRLGLLAIVGVAALGYGAWTKRVPFAHRYEVRAVFASSTQLRPGSPVRIAGVDVGRVSGLTAGPGPGTTVSLEIRPEGRPLHTDATARIRPRVFLEGGFIVQLDPGTPSAPLLGDGGTIPLPQTEVPVQFDQILSTLDAPVRQSLRTGVNEVSIALGGGGAAGLRRTFRPLAPTLRDGAVLTEAVRGTEAHDLSELIRSSDRATTAVARRAPELAGLVTALHRTTAALAARRAELAASVGEFDGFVRALPGALDAIDRAVPSIRQFIATLRPSLPLAAPALHSLTALRGQLDALNRSGARPSEVARTLTLLRPLLQELPRFSLLARGAFPVVGPVATCARDHVMPVLKARLDDGALSTGRPVWQDFLHGMVGLASAAQSFDGNGGWLRYLAGAGTETVSTGALPGIDRLFGTVVEPLTGSRPVWAGPGTRPPVRPDAPCADQPAPDLDAGAGPAMVTGAGVRAAPRTPITLSLLRRLALHPAVRVRTPGGTR